MKRYNLKTDSAGQLQKLQNLLGRDSGRLVHDHVLCCLKRAKRDVEVRRVGSCDDDQLDGSVRQEIVNRAVDSNAGIALFGVVSGALNDCGEFQTLDGRNQGRVEDAARHTKTHKPDSDHRSLLKLAGTTHPLITLRAYTVFRPAGTGGAKQVDSW